MSWDRGERVGALFGLVAVLLIGGSVAASSLLHAYPLVGGQAIRFATGAVVLVSWGLLRRHKFRLPTAREFMWLVLVAASGMAGYGVMLVYATSVTEPGNIGMAIGASPLAIVLVRAALARSRPAGGLLLGSLIVIAGTTVAQASSGQGLQWSAESVFWMLMVMVGAASITLLSAPVIATLGPFMVTAYGCAIAAALLFAVGGVVQASTGSAQFRVADAVELAALAFLAVAVTVLVMLLWFGAMARLGPSRTGLFNGLVPLASIAAVAITGSGGATWQQLLGAVFVLIGVVVGLRSAGRSQR